MARWPQNSEGAIIVSIVIFALLANLQNLKDGELRLLSRFLILKHGVVGCHGFRIKGFYLDLIKLEVSY